MELNTSITKTRKSTANPPHLFLGLITGGMWTVLVHIPLLLARCRKQKAVTTYYAPKAG